MIRLHRHRHQVREGKGEPARLLVFRAPLTIVVTGVVEELSDLVVDLLVITLLRSESHDGLSCLLDRLCDCRPIVGLRVIPISASGSDYSAKGEPQNRVAAFLRSFGGVSAAESIFRVSRNDRCAGSSPKSGPCRRGKRPRRRRGFERGSKKADKSHVERLDVDTNQSSSSLSLSLSSPNHELPIMLHPLDSLLI